MSDVLEKFSEAYEQNKREEMTVAEYLKRASEDRWCYATASERLLKAIGEPRLVDTSLDPRLRRIFQNRTIKVYDSFKDFYGIEDVIERLVSYFTHAAQGLEERKQILYLRGPVGTAKSSLAEHLKYLIQKEPIYVLAVKNAKGETELSPCFESPLGLFAPDKFAVALEKDYNIPRRYLTGLLSPWAVKRLDDMDGDLSRFCVVKVNPNKLRQLAVAKIEPGDENNQDISTLVGKVDLRKLDKFSQSDSDAYAYSGALCRGNQGVVEFVEMFKAPIKTLHPLLTAMQEGNYVGTEEIGAIPFQGIVVSHSNETEWAAFASDKKNEAFIDRIYTVKVPYCLRVDEEVKIYEKMISLSELYKKPIAPHTLSMLAQFAILTRLDEHGNSNLPSKMKVYNGEDLTDKDLNARTIQEYLDQADPTKEGMMGISTRFAFKILSETYNKDWPTEVAADPVHLILVLMDAIKRENLKPEMEQKYISYIRDHLSREYANQIGKEIQVYYLEAYGSYGQNQFDKYIAYADAWCDRNDFKDPDTGMVYDREALNTELEKIERPAGIANPKDFRQEVVKFVIKRRADHGGQNPPWTSYQKLREVIEKKIFAATEDLLPIVSFTTKRNSEDEKKHADFLARMMAKGYTERQCQRLVEWWMRHQKSG